MKRQREYPFITNSDDLQPRGHPEDIDGTLDQTGVAWLNVFNQFSIIGVVRVQPFVIAHLSWLNDIVALGTR